MARKSGGRPHLLPVEEMPCDCEHHAMKGAVILASGIEHGKAYSSMTLLFAGICNCR